MQDAIATPAPALRAENYAPPDALGRVRTVALAAGVAGTLLLAVGWFLDAEQFYRSYLVAWLLWVGVAAGSLGLLMLHHLSRGAWGLIIRRILEAAARTLPLLLVLFLPIAYGMGYLFPWSRAEAAGDEIIQHKVLYLNKTFFLLRALLYFAVLSGFAYLLSRLSRRQDRTADPGLFRRMQTVSGPGLPLFVLFATFASADWLMSLDPHWYSSLYGLHFLISQGLAALTFTVLAVVWLGARRPMSLVVQARHLHDYGKLLLAFVMVWAYFSFSQFLIIWSGNLPEEITFFLNRLHGGWKPVSAALIVLHFALPFLLLLSRDLKRSGKTLAAIAGLLFFARYLDIYWQAAPSFHSALVDGTGAAHGGLDVSWLDAVSPIALGGLWLWFFAGQLQRTTLLPIHDPYLADALEHD